MKKEVQVGIYNHVILISSMTVKKYPKVRHFTLLFIFVRNNYTLNTEIDVLFWLPLYYGHRILQIFDRF